MNWLWTLDLCRYADMVKYVESCCILNFLWVPVPSGTLGSQPWPAASLAPWACCAAHSDPMDPMAPSSRWGRGHWTPWRLRALCSAAAWWVAKRRPRPPRWKSRIAADWIRLELERLESQRADEKPDLGAMKGWLQLLSLSISVPFWILNCVRVFVCGACELSKGTVSLLSKKWLGHGYRLVCVFCPWHDPKCSRPCI